MSMDEILKKPRKLSTDDKLFLNKFKVNGNKPHLKLKNEKICGACANKPCLYVCPVGNYQKENGSIRLSWEGCLECGACRIACPERAIEWEYPQGGYGINYRYG